MDHQTADECFRKIDDLNWNYYGSGFYKGSEIESFNQQALDFLDGYDPVYTGKHAFSHITYPPYGYKSLEWVTQEVYF